MQKRALRSGQKTELIVPTVSGLVPLTNQLDGFTIWLDGE